MSDTPESVRSAIAALYAGEYTSMGAADAAADIMENYAASLERDNARIKELEGALSTATFWWREYMDEAHGLHPLDDLALDEVRADWSECMALLPIVEVRE